MSKKKNIDDVLAAMRPTGAPASEPPAPVLPEFIEGIAPEEPHPLTQVQPQPSAMEEIDALHKRLEIEPDEIEREKIVQRLEAVEMAAMSDAADRAAASSVKIFSDDTPRPPAVEPTIGRVVHYKAGTGRTYAALIVFVFPDYNHVNLTIFSHEGHVSAVENVAWGYEIGNWSWPPRV